MSKKKNSKNSKNFKPQVPEKKIIETKDEKKSGNKLKILSLAILVWSAVIYGLYIPAVSQSLGGTRDPQTETEVRAKPNFWAVLEKI